MVEIINYFKQVEQMENVASVLINVKTHKDIDFVVMVNGVAFIRPIRNMIEANFYTNRALNVIRIKNISNRELMALTAFNDTLKIKITENMEVKNGIR